MTAKKGCADTAHDFEKFDDATIYCRRCGNQRIVEVEAVIERLRALPVMPYLPCPGPHYPQPVIWTAPNTATPWRWVNPNITITSGSTTYTPPDNVMVYNG